MPRPRRTFPELKRRANGVYYAGEYVERAGRTVWTSLHTKDEDDARKRFANYLIDGPGSAKPRGYADVTVDHVLDWYERDHIEPKVVDKGRQYDAIANLRAFFGGTPIADVDVAMSKAYAEARQRGDVQRERVRKARNGGAAAGSTIRRELVVLVAAVNSAVYLKKLPKGSEIAVELPAEEKSTDAPWLTKETLVRAFDLARPNARLHAFMLLAYYTAGRRRSIERLTKAQVDLKHGRINLQPVNSPKTNKCKPIVPIYPEIRPTLERLMAESTTEYVFGTPESFYKPFVELMADIGVEAWPHLLRHSRATHMLMDGEDPYKVAKLLGDTLTTVEKRYGHASVDYLQTKSSLGV